MQIGRFMFKNLVLSITCSKFANEKFIIVNRIMDLVSRLKLFLEQNGIANSQFADTCEIPRPTISQLLNGRNKKVSDEVISKIHGAYPNLNIMWLMFGDGNMFVDASIVGADDTSLQNLSKTPQQGPLFLGGNQGENLAKRTPSTISFGDEKSARNNTGTALSDAIQNIAKSVSGSNSSATNSGNRGRRIVNIMIFYDDNSFESITPAR